MPASLEHLTDVLAAIVRGDREAFGRLQSWDPETIQRVARQHGVLPLLADRVAARPDMASAMVDRLQAEAHGHAAADLLREVELRKVLEAFDRDQVEVLLIKGAHLAYAYYPRADLRPRGDTDVLIAASRRREAHATLTRSGYDAPEQLAGEVVTRQRFYEMRRDGVRIHGIDLHWQIANPQVFASLMSFEELRAAAVPVPRLAASARGLAGPHALLVACVHRVAHHYDDDCLIWLYDIHLIASALPPEDWDVFTALARDRGVLSICRQGLGQATEAFGTVVPAGLAAGRGDLRPPGQQEATAAFLGPGRPQLQTLTSNLRALSSWRERGRLIREHVFPSARYMRQVFAPASRAPLPLLYVWRIVRGARRWLRRREAH